MKLGALERDGSRFIYCRGGLVNLLKEEPVAPVGHMFMVGMAVVCFFILALAVVLVGK